MKGEKKKNNNNNNNNEMQIILRLSEAYGKI